MTVEDLKRSVNFFELGDGYHPIPADCVFVDREGKRPPVVLIFDSLVAPYGTKQTNDFCDRIWDEVDTIKDAGGLPSVSTPFARHLDALMKPVMQYGSIILTGALIAYAFLSNGGL